MDMVGQFWQVSDHHSWARLVASELHFSCNWKDLLKDRMQGMREREESKEDSTVYIPVARRSK